MKQKFLASENYYIKCIPVFCFLLYKIIEIVKDDSWYIETAILFTILLNLFTLKWKHLISVQMTTIQKTLYGG